MRTTLGAILSVGVAVRTLALAGCVSCGDVHEELNQQEQRLEVLRGDVDDAFRGSSDVVRKESLIHLGLAVDGLLG